MAIILDEETKAKYKNAKRGCPQLFKDPIVLKIKDDVLREGTDLTEEAITNLHKMNSGFKSHDLAYGLAMKEGDKILLHYRESQPCYGELRKYHAIHDDYTDPQPTDHYRPGDLYWPFPDGTPVGLALRLRNKLPKNNQKKLNNTLENCLDFLFSDESPWVRGVPSSDYVEYTRDNNGEIIGLVFLHLDVDPTVMVQLINSTIKRVKSHADLYNVIRFREEGASWAEVFALWQEIEFGCISEDKSDVYNFSSNQNRGYYTPIFFDVKAFFNQNPLDLTGGTLKDRYDYNRVRLHDVWSDEKKGETGGDTFVGKIRKDKLGAEANNCFAECKMSHKEVLNAFREEYKHCYEDGQEIKHAA